MIKLTAKQNDLLKRHQMMNEGSLFDAYDNPSMQKRYIWESIQKEARELGAITNLKVNSFNTFMFTASFEYEKDGKRMLRYYMPSETFDFEI